MHFRCRWFAAIIALALPVHNDAQAQSAPSPPGAERFTDAATALIAAINADDQAAIQQMFNEAMQTALPAEKTGPFFRGLVTAQGELQAAGPPEVNGPTANVRVTAERGDWNFEITLDSSDKIAGLRVLPGNGRPEQTDGASPASDRDSDEGNSYLDLRRSDDRSAQLMAERYFSLIRRQEWVDSTGKSKVMAKYVDHDPDLEWVKIEAVRGRGAERVEKEITVPIAKLSKTCQSRVRQIATLQKKLDELLATADETETSGETSFTDPGSPMVDERGFEPPPRREPRRAAIESSAVETRSPPRASTSEDPSSADFDPDPLGFGEIDFSSSAALLPPNQ